MHIKRSIAALAVTGGAAALAFGGSAVATDFTGNSVGSVTTEAATFGGNYSTGQIDISNALPGDTVTKEIYYKNTGSTPVNLVLTTGALTTNGPAGVSLAKDLLVEFPGHLGKTMSDLATTPWSIAFNNIQPGGVMGRWITVTLPQTATVADAGGAASLVYTLTATATH